MKNLKKQFTILVLGLSVLPFAFYELKGPFGVHRDVFINKSVCPIDLLDENSETTLCIPNEVNKYFYVCLYNGQTGYSIGLISWNFPLNPYIKFFEGKIGINDFQKDDYLTFYLIKEKPDLMLKNSTDLSEAQNIEKMSKTPPPKFLLSPMFTTSSNITIENINDNVQMSKDGKKFPFERALKKWFSNDGKELEYINNAVVKSTQNVKNSEKNETNDPLFKNSRELSNMGDRLNRKIVLDEKAKTLLKNSKILAVYAVFKGDDNKNSIVWGLGEDTTDPDNKRRFHWITDLTDDIAKLIE